MARPQCKGCGAIIRWLPTRAGKAMPVDPDRLTKWLTDQAVQATTAGTMEPAQRKKITVLTPEGDLVTGYQGSILTPGSREVVGYVPHWATCPRAKEFKR